MTGHINRRTALTGAAAGLALAGTPGASTGAVAGQGAAQGQGAAKVTAPLFALPQMMISVVGEERGFPVRRIYCIGRNYPEHSREMGSDPTRELPFFFQKPSDAIEFVAIGTVGDHPYPR